MTLRELAEMAEARLRAEWSQTSEILALIYNINRPAKTKAIPSWKFNPFGEPPKRKAKRAGPEAWAIFKSLVERGVFGGQRR